MNFQVAAVTFSLLLSIHASAQIRTESVFSSFNKPCSRTNSFNLISDKPLFENGKFDQPVFNFGIEQGWRMMGQIGIGMADTKFRFNGFFPLWYFRQLQIGSQFNFSFKHPIVGPFIAYDATSRSKRFGTYFGYGISAIYLSNPSAGSLYVSPRIGLRMLAIYNLMIGYNIPVLGSELEPYVNRLNVSLTFMLFKRASIKSISQ
jgi:hypothetical protein